MSKIITYDAPENAPLSKDYEILVNESKIPVYGSESRYGSDVSFASFDFEGTAEITVNINFGAYCINSFEILPKNLEIVPERINDFSCKFTIDRPQKLTILVNGDYTGRVLHLFANAPETDIPDKTNPNVIYFEKGYHVIEGENSELTLKSNQTLYIEGGAFVIGRVTAKNAENIKIRGRGILAYTHEQPMPNICFELIECKNIDVSGIIINRRHGNWTGLFRSCCDIHVHDLKIVSTAIWSTDGLNLSNCQNALYEDSFIRAGDDCISIKGLENGGPYASDMQQAVKNSRPNENITVKNMIFWSDNNNAVVVGEETVARHYDNITFDNCDVLFCRDEEKIKAAIAVICMHGTLIQNITFKNFRVGPCGQLIAVFFADSLFGIPGSLLYSPGTMKNILIQNVTAYGAGSKYVRIEGLNDRNFIENIKLKDITVRGKKLSHNSDNLKTNDYIQSLEIV